jgi:RNA polymerase sporulation-specific sigma factor
MAIAKDKPATTDEAIKAMHRTICKVAHQYLRNHYGDFDDLYQRGAEGVLKAYQNFDSTKGASFSTHAYPWIWSHVKATAHDNWSHYNNKSSVPVENAMGDSAYDMDLDSMIDMKRKIMAQDTTTQKIIMARLEGYTFREIAEAIGDMTLHQCRKRYMEIMEND